jgi:hypothetical protein
MHFMLRILILKGKKGDWGVFRTLFLNHNKIPNLEPISKSKKNILFLHFLSLIFDLETRFFHAYSYTFFEQNQISTFSIFKP